VVVDCLRVGHPAQVIFQRTLFPPSRRRVDLYLIVLPSFNRIAATRSPKVRYREISLFWQSARRVFSTRSNDPTEPVVRFIDCFAIHVTFLLYSTARFNGRVEFSSLFDLPTGRIHNNVITFIEWRACT